MAKLNCGHKLAENVDDSIVCKNRTWLLIGKYCSQIEFKMLSGETKVNFKLCHSTKARAMKHSRSTRKVCSVACNSIQN